MLSEQVKLWKAPGGGVMIVDEVVAKHEIITFALAHDASGAVKAVEIRDSHTSAPLHPARWIKRRPGLFCPREDDHV